MTLDNENKYLFANERSFFEQVFAGDDRYIAVTDGLVSAHADKCEQYRDFWESHGIPQEHAILVYLLTYTKVFGDNLKHKSKEWVVDNYPTFRKYLP